VLQGTGWEDHWVQHRPAQLADIHSRYLESVQYWLAAGLAQNTFLLGPQGLYKQNPAEHSLGQLELIHSAN
jgi:hypothetical protein